MENQTETGDPAGQYPNQILLDSPKKSKVKYFVNE